MFWSCLRYRFPYIYFFLLLLVLCFPFPQSILPPFHLPNFPPIVFPLKITLRLLVFLINSTRRIYWKQQQKKPYTSFGKWFTTRHRFSLILWHKQTMGESASCSEWVHSGCLHQKCGSEGGSAPVQLLCCEHVRAGGSIHLAELWPFSFHSPPHQSTEMAGCSERSRLKETWTRRKH